MYKGTSSYPFPLSNSDAMNQKPLSLASITKSLRYVLDKRNRDDIRQAFSALSRHSLGKRSNFRLATMVLAKYERVSQRYFWWLEVLSWPVPNQTFSEEHSCPERGDLLNLSIYVDGKLYQPELVDKYPQVIAPTNLPQASLSESHAE